MLGNFALGRAPQGDVLRHIAELHHETIDGAGYPNGLHGTEIPIEARIVAVADVFDALTSRRPYKPAWRNDVAFATLERLAGRKLDADCVAALLAHREEVGEIQRRFHECVV
jgi:HD-GYP domain-containing protein (c-di-GMP phosphodiesterase class II)